MTRYSLAVSFVMLALSSAGCAVASDGAPSTPEASGPGFLVADTEGALRPAAPPANGHDRVEDAKDNAGEPPLFSCPPQDPRHPTHPRCGQLAETGFAHLPAESD